MNLYVKTNYTSGIWEMPFGIPWPRNCRSNLFRPISRQYFVAVKPVPVHGKTHIPYTRSNLFSVHKPFTIAS
jgi:hypothetical protein